MLRFAPSPTGDMHIGDLRVALFNYIVSKQRNEDLIVRKEDIDKEENIEGKDEEILGLLSLFGIEHTQVIYQSELVRYHSAMALQLIHYKKTFLKFSKLSLRMLSSGDVSNIIKNGSAIMVTGKQQFNKLT